MEISCVCDGMSVSVVKFSRNGPERRSSTSSWRSTTSNWRSCTLEGRSCTFSQSFNLPQWQCLKFVHVHVAVWSKHLNETIYNVYIYDCRTSTSCLCLSFTLATLHVCCNFSRFMVPQFHHSLDCPCSKRTA